MESAYSEVPGNSPNGKRHEQVYIEVIWSPWELEQV